MKTEFIKIVDKPTACVTLVHTFKDVMPDVDEFFQANTEPGVITTVNSFTGRVNDLAEKYNLVIESNIFKGHSLELLAEFLIKFNAADNRIGIYDYCPIEGDDDFGADGVGVGENGNPATVQVKFRRGDWVLTANDDHLTNFVARSQNMNGVRMEDTKNMLIITTGLKVDERTMDNMLYNKVRVLNREALREMLDNRPEWWMKFWEAVKGSRVGKANALPKISLRNHQMEAVDVSVGTDLKNGKVILPTGTGKTVIESDIILQTINQLVAKGKVPVIKINASRILLCFQLFEEIFSYLNSYGVKACYVNFNSGTPDDHFYKTEMRKHGSGCFRELLSTTSPKAVKSSYEKCLQDKLPMLIFSTYHSAVKFSLSEVVPDLTIHDEAHNLVSNEFYRVARLETGKNLFFTATEKVNDAGLGMDNEEYFGKIIYTKSPREMIEAGEMVAPHVHVVRAKKGIVVNMNKLDRDYEALFKSIADAFFAHQLKLNEESSDPSKLGAKILVVCRGQKDLEEMFETKVFEMFRKQYPNIHLFALSTDFGLYNGDDAEPMTKSPVTSSKKFKFLNKIKKLGSAEKAIIFHVDMIGEGIDVPGITGVMPFRNSEVVKFVQNIGRASRLHPEDRKKIYADEIDVSDRTKWIKPRSWVIIPEFLESSEGFSDRLRGIIHLLRNDYGYIPRQDTFIDNVRGLEEDEPIDKDNKKDKNSPHADSGLREFDHEFETPTEAVSLTEKIIFDDGVDQHYEKSSAELEALIIS
jgi:superfamily II DNA or RNA helicase